MNLFIRLFIILLVILPTACNKKKQELVDPIKDTSLDLQMIEAYKKGLEELEKGQALIAAKKFNEAEILFPQSQWAPRSALMSAYSYFDFGYYGESIDEVNRFLKNYPNSDRKNYAYYLKAMSYYNQIVDEKKDLGPIIEAKESFKLIILQYPNCLLWLQKSMLYCQIYFVLLPMRPLRGVVLPYRYRHLLLRQ